MAPDAVENALLDTAKGDGQWNEKFGHGQLDLAAALTKTEEKWGATRFALGAVFALLIAQLAATGRSFQVKSGAIAGIVAGGLFFLDLLPLPNTLLVRVLATPFLEWPALLIGHGWAAFPLWLSALVPLAIGFTLGAFERTRWVAFGLACGIGAHLMHGAATGSLDPAWLPATLGTAWLVGNATACVVLGLGLAGAQKLEEAERLGGRR
jgi:hypothetical protein